MYIASMVFLVVCALMHMLIVAGTEAEPHPPASQARLGAVTAVYILALIAVYALGQSATTYAGQSMAWILGFCLAVEGFLVTGFMKRYREPRSSTETGLIIFVRMTQIAMVVLVVAL